MSTTEADLDEIGTIRKLTTKGEFDSALKTIENLPEDKRLEGDVLKSRILRYQLHFQTASALIHETLPKIESPLLKLEALIEHAFVLNSTSKDTLGRESIQQAEELYQSILNKHSENDLELKDLEAKLYHVKARYVLFDQQNIDQAYLYLQKSLKISETTGNKHQLAGIHRSLGYISLNRFNIDQALKHYHTSLELYQQVGNIETQRINFRVIAKIYDEKGDLDQALENALKSLDIHIKYKIHQEHILRVIASIYWKMGNLNKTQQIMEQALEQANNWWTKNAPNKSYFPNTTFTALENLFRLALIQGNIDAGKDLYSQMKKIYSDHKVILNKESLNYFNDRINLANALLLKQHNRIRFKMQAQEILTGIVNNSSYSIYDDIIIYAIPALCDLLLDELKTYGEAEVLAETKDLIKKFTIFTTENHLYPLVIEALILDSKLSLIEGEITKAGEILDKALIITKEKQLIFLQSMVIQEKQELEANLDTWNNLVEQNASMYERINQSKFQNYLKKAQAQLYLDK